VVCWLLEKDLGNTVSQLMQAGTGIVLPDGIRELIDGRPDLDSLRQFAQAIDSSDNVGDQAMRNVQGHLLMLSSLNSKWSFAVQGFIARQHGNHDFVSFLRGEFRSASICARSPHGNFALGAILETFGAWVTTALCQELRGDFRALCKHQYGYKVLLKILNTLKHHADWRGMEDLLEEAIPDASDLACDQYGNFVIREVFALKVVVPREFTARLLWSISEDAEHVCNDSYGHHVAREALKNNRNAVLRNAWDAAQRMWRNRGRQQV